MSLRVRVLKTVSEVPADVWNRVLGPDPVPVLRWEWLNALESSGSATARKGWDGCHFTLWRGDVLIGLAPAWRKHHSMGEYVYDFAWANAAQQLGVEYYPKLLIGVPLSPLTAPRFVAAPGENAAEVRAALLKAADALATEEGLSSLHVIFPPEAEALALEKAGLFRRLGMQYHWKNPGYRTYDDYLSRFDSKRRNQLKREKGAAATQGISLRTIRRPGPAEAKWAFKFYESTVSKNGWGQLQLNQKFFELAFAALPDSVELVVAERAGEVIAGAFNLSTKTRLYGRYWGCFEEHPFLHFNVCLYHSVEDCIARGLQVFEPGAGGEHKISRGFEPSAIHSAHRVYAPRLSKAIEQFTQRERAEVEKVVADSMSIAGMKPFSPA